MSKKSIKARLTDHIERFSSAIIKSRPQKPDEEIMRKLRAAGLDEHEAELVFYRFIENKSMKQLIKDQGWVNYASAAHYLKRALQKLRKGKFSL